MSEAVTLIAFSCGFFHTPVGLFIEGEENQVIRAPVPAYLIEHPTGKALFDTGLGVRFRSELGFKLPLDEPGFEFDESAEIASRLRAYGVDPGEIRWIINSHLHGDHCGGNVSIPNATVIVQREEADFAPQHENGWNYHSAEYDTGHPVLAIHGEHDLFGDGSVVIFPTTGHTPGHQSVRILLPKGPVVLTADCCYLKRSLDEMVLSPSNYDREQSLKTLATLRSLRDRGDRLFYGHDLKFWKTIPQGVPIL